MSHKANYEAIPLSTGTYEVGDLGNGVTASTVHQVFCTTGGAVTITAWGGGTFSWTATAGQSVNVEASRIIVGSGAFVAFREKFGSGRVNTVNIFRSDGT